jgi:hypothetical protein
MLHIRLYLNATIIEGQTDEAWELEIIQYLSNVRENWK